MQPTADELDTALVVIDALAWDSSGESIHAYPDAWRAAWDVLRAAWEAQKASE